MDEALVLCAVDVSGRGVLRYNVKFPTEKVGDFDTELVKEFWLAFVRTAGVTLHVLMIDGENSHHVAEAIYKGVARSLSAALLPDPRFEGRIPSSKGVL
jgi:imidazoleglycerol-phosphate dehydratase